MQNRLDTLVRQEWELNAEIARARQEIAADQVLCQQGKDRWDKTHVYIVLHRISAGTYYDNPSAKIAVYLTEERALKHKGSGVIQKIKIGEEKYIGGGSTGAKGMGD